MVFFHQEISDIEFGIKGEPGWQQALELVLSGFGRRRERTLGPGLTEGWYSAWQGKLTADQNRNQTVPRFLNEIGLLTTFGRRWN